ncbi:MAG: thiamine diphosphokinase [Holosporales bacterium]|jgi:thiamine pyrophosphokinase|nr:thiamine diphosphokinase [Holosporales bacterium]
MIKDILGDVSSYKSILCLDGNLMHSGFIADFELPKIATDGAANQLVSHGITPDLIIGDLDSVSPELLTEFNHLRLDDQDTSDFQKALAYMAENALLPCIIFGMSGGYIDHIINNINIFLSYDENVFIDGSIIGFKIIGKNKFQLPINTKLSILGIPKCEITTSGLKWELNSACLTFASYEPQSKLFGYSSCFNRTASSNFEIDIISGTALLLVYSENIIDAGYTLGHAKK